MNNTKKNVASKKSIWSTKQIATMALLAAIAILLSFIELPLFPAAPFLKYDPSFMVAAVGGFALGPVAGIIVGVLSAIFHGLISGNITGALMNILVVIAFVAPSAIIYRKNRTIKGGSIGLIVSAFASIIAAIIANLIITPLYMGVPFQAVVDMILPILIPFNALKTILNSALTLVVYKSISKLISKDVRMQKGAKSSKAADNLNEEGI